MDPMLFVLIGWLVSAVVIGGLWAWLRSREKARQRARDNLTSALSFEDAINSIYTQADRDTIRELAGVDPKTAKRLGF